MIIYTKRMNDIAYKRGMIWCDTASIRPDTASIRPRMSLKP